MKTATQAIDEGIKGNWSRSFDLALMDEGIDKSITLLEWQQYVAKIAGIRAEMDSVRNAPMPPAYYS